MVILILLIKLLSGCLLPVDPEAVHQAVEKNPVTNQRKVLVELNLSKPTIPDHLHRLNKVNRWCKKIPHELTIEQEQKPVEIWGKLLQYTFDESFFFEGLFLRLFQQFQLTKSMA